MELKFPILSLITIFFTAGCVREAQVDMPGFNYMENKIFLDVRNIKVINRYQPERKDLAKAMLPASIIPELEHWIRNRFVAAGSKGVAVITILDAKVVEQGLSELDKTHETFTTGAPDKFGASAQIVMEVKNAKNFVEGRAEIDLNREMSIEIDVKMSFIRQLWAGFMQNFMNALEDQFIINIETYLPGLTIPAFAFNQMAKKRLEELEQEDNH